MSTSTKLKYVQTPKGSNVILLKEFFTQAEILGLYKAYENKFLKSFEENKDYVKIPEKGILISEQIALKLLDTEIEWYESAVAWNTKFLEQVNDRLTKRNVSSNLEMFTNKLNFLRRLK